MGIPNILQTGKSGMMASRAAIATTGHNISNANTEGYSRQRVQTTPLDLHGAPYSKNRIGTGTTVNRIERMNDAYIEKQIRNGGRDMANYEEKDIALRQTEDIFNEMNGDGLNRLVARFFNEFRKLSDEPENEAIRQAVREASAAMVNDFHRLRNEVNEVREHIDSRIEGYMLEVNQLTEDIKKQNRQIVELEAIGGQPNDLYDKRDVTLKKLGEYLDISMHKDRQGSYMIDIKNVGPLIAGPENETFSAERSPEDDQGKPAGSFDIRTSASANGVITHQLRGGKLGALVEVRDKTLNTILSRLDELAFSISHAVNAIHEQGVTPRGAQGVSFFNRLDTMDRAAEFLDLSDAVKSNVNNIATAAVADAPGDNRIALAIAGIQQRRIMGEGNATIDSWYNSMISEVGVASSKNKFALNQQRDINTQLAKFREQISGVSIDEETTQLMQYQHLFDASSKVIQVADEMMKTVLNLKRD